mgnify:CR=1 FL=1
MNYEDFLKPKEEELPLAEDAIAEEDNGDNEEFVEVAEDIDSAKNEINAKIAGVRTELMAIINGYNTAINAKIDSEVARLDEKIETYPIANTQVFNSLRGYTTTLQDYLDDLSGLNRTDAISASEYDTLELTATEYDAKEITAHDYDYFGKTILMA